MTASHAWLRSDDYVLIAVTAGLGQLPVDVKAIACDVLKGAGRKFLRGPRGTALLYVRRSFLDRMEPPYLDVLSGPWRDDAPVVRDDARRFGTSENAFALQLGLGAAIRYTLEVGVDAIKERIDVLARLLRGQLADIPGVRVNDAGQERSGFITFMVDSVSPQEVQRSLAADRINVAATAAAYTPLDMAFRGLNKIIRASVTYFTTEAEIDHLADAVAALRRKLKMRTSILGQ